MEFRLFYRKLLNPDNFSLFLPGTVSV